MKARRPAPAVGSLPRHGPNKFTAIVLPEDVVVVVHCKLQVKADRSKVPGDLEYWLGIFRKLQEIWSLTPSK